jgi:UDP-N-acetylmuramoylalanine--D-glutamate ligase
MDVRNKVYWVIGLARSGCAAGQLLRRHGARVLGVDDGNEGDIRRRWEREGLTNMAPEAFDELFVDGNWPLMLPDSRPDAVIVSPGVPLENPHLCGLPGDIPILGELELGARFCQAKLVAITGTNGKSTTTEMIAHILRQTGARVEALGNLGQPLSLVADEMDPEDIAVVEVSSFQLETVNEFCPQVGLCLNLAPDHQDRYPDLQAYFAAKENLAKLVSPDGSFITWTECPEARQWQHGGTLQLFGVREKGASVYFQDEKLYITRNEKPHELMPMDDLALQSPPNFLNALASVSAGLAMGLGDAPLRKGLQSFRGLRHRHEIVGELNGMRFINDTKATNVHAVCAGLDGYRGKVVLVAGGSGKGEDYSPLRDVMGAVCHVVLLGAEGPAIGEALDSVVATTLVSSMDEAVALAVNLGQPDADVLLSPACASFDMFANYRQRGEAFTAAALKLGAVEPGEDQ